MNTIILTGRITKDPELKQYNGKNGMFETVNFSLAVRRDTNNTDFINCQAFGKTAQLLAQYCKKGSMIGIEGNLKQETYQSVQGQKVTTFKVIVNHLEFLGGTQQSQQAQQDRPVYEEQIALARQYNQNPNRQMNYREPEEMRQLNTMNQEPQVRPEDFGINPKDLPF